MMSMLLRIFSPGYSWLLGTYLLFFTSLTIGQAQIKGQVTDAKTNEPLVFVAVVVNNTSKGTTTDIDGNYMLSVDSDQQIISFRYVGYETLNMSVDALKKQPNIKLTADTKVLKEVTVLAGENPAHRIIRRLVANKKKLNPSTMDSYSFESYNKVQVGSDIIPNIDEEDTVEVKMRDYVKDSYLFSMESITKREYEHPNNLKETILANRVSGFKTLQIATVASTFQNIGFYDDYVSIMSIDFLNPISKNSFDNYFFDLADSLVENGRKSYIIAFEPRKNTFNGFKGVLQVDSTDMALKSVTAETTGFAELHDMILRGESQFANKSKSSYTLDNYLTVNFKLQQNYRPVEGSVWFPDQLKADFFISEYHRKGSPSFPIMAISKSYIKNIQVLPDLSDTRFTRTVQRFDPLSLERNDEFWQDYRPEDLTKKEVETYTYLDSMMEAEGAERILNIFSGLPEKKIHLGGPLDINLNRAFDFNRYEGFRLGMGLSTSDKLSRHFELGGYWAYGFRDKADKYGGYLDIHILDEDRLDLFASYTNDIYQFGGIQAYKYRSLVFDTDNFYNFFSERAYTAETYEAGMRFYWLKFLDTQLSLKKQNVTINDDYRYQASGSEAGEALERFDLTEVSLKMGYNYGVYQTEALNGFLRTQRSKLYVGGEITRGLSNTLEGEFSYNKYGFTLQNQFRTRSFGHISLLLEAGYVDEAIPATHLFNIRGTSDEQLDVGNSFRTMGINEFVANKFVNAFYSHKVTQFTIDPKFSEPQVFLQGAAAYGQLDQQERHLGNTFTALDDFYFEAGILVRRIFKIQGMEFGGGVYNRMGTYSFDDNFDNLFFKVDFSLDLGE